MPGIYLCVCVCARVPLWLDYMRKRCPRTARLEVNIPASAPPGAVREQGQQQFHWNLGQENIARMSAGNFSLPLAFPRGGLCPWPLLTPYFSSWVGPTSDGGCGRLDCLPPANVCPGLFSATPRYPVLQGELAVSSTPCARWVSLISG